MLNTNYFGCKHAEKSSIWKI